MIRFISGVPPALSIGAGRFISQLEETFPVSYGGNKSAAGLAYSQRRPLKFAIAVALHYFRRAKLALEIRANAFARTSDTLVIYHPQELGWEKALRIIEASPRMAWLYVLDMSFFCVRSYNYIPGENDACFRCLGGNFENIARMGCEPFPSAMNAPAETLERLRELAARGRVGFLLQGKSQEILLKRHFGPEVTMKHVGLWTVDFEADLAAPLAAPTSADAYDVVFHGPELPAKGFFWTLEVAKLTPSLRYLFPMSVPEGVSPPANCAFVPLRWESGLREQVLSAKLTLVPSLWSAVIEGALIKSVCLAPRTGVIEIDGAYSQEIPPEIILKLPSAPADAAKKITDALASGWQPEAEKLTRWKDEFVRFNRALASRLAKEL